MTGRPTTSAPKGVGPPTKWVLPYFHYPKVSDNRRSQIITEEHLAQLKPFLLDPKRGKDEKTDTPRKRHDLYDILRLGIQTACRIQELLSLEWLDLDHRPGQLRVYSKKLNRVHYVPITDVAREIFERRKKTATGPSVFGYDFCKNYDTLYHVFRRACKAAGLDFGLSGITFHTTRHTAITTLLTNGVDFRTVMEFAGHTQIRNTERYAHITPSSAEQAKRVLARYSAEAPVADSEERILELLAPEDRKLWNLLSDESRQKLAGILPEKPGKMPDEGNVGKPDT